MLNKILVANRGEIACRIFRCCKKTGIKSVAVYSDPDAGSLHATSADEAVHLPGATSAETYLDQNAILKAAKQTGAQAIHPGYGFLAENAEFAKLVVDAGLIFIGPSPEAMLALGDKISARKIAQACKVPLLPEVLLDGARTADEKYLGTLKKTASDIGYPLLVKAAAGGGGRGMRIVEDFDSLADAIRAAQREAQSFFSNETVYLEKYISGARHIEVQIIADTHGNVFHLLERDCSLQRRHQKVIEEAPIADRKLAKQLQEAAVKICQQAQYAGAGTVEFLVSDTGDFYFLEVNSRLQVEHPVTEQVLNVDLVDLQIKAASGVDITPLLPARSLEQPPARHSIECRICAEDPDDNFLAVAGQLRQFQFPTSKSIRVDTGFQKGDEVSHYYDSLLAKLIVTADTRELALDMAIGALRDSAVFGLTTNVPFLLQLLRSRSFQNDSHNLQHAGAVLDSPPDNSTELCTTAALYLKAKSIASSRDRTRQVRMASGTGWRLTGSSPQQVKLQVGTQTETFSVAYLQDSSILVSRLQQDQNQPSPATQVRFLSETRDQFHYSSKDTQGVCPFLKIHDGVIWLSTPLGPLAVTEIFPLEKAGSSSSEALPPILSSRLPATVLEVMVEEGVTVEADAVLLTLESMKMEHAVRSPARATVGTLEVEAGQTVEAGAPLLHLQYCTEV